MPQPAENTAGGPQDYSYSAKDITIRLARGDSKAELPGEIWVERDGLVCWKTSHVDLTDQTKWLTARNLEEKQTLAYLKLQANVQEDGVFTSDHAYITRHSPTLNPGKPSTVAVSGQMADAKLTYAIIPATSTGLAVSYLAVGMKGFRPVSLESPVGLITQRGPDEVENYDNLAGFVIIQAPSKPSAAAEWLKQCDPMAMRVFDMLSLAQGRLIRWSVRQIETEERVLEIEFSGPRHSGPPQWPVFHRLNLAPALDLAVNRYTDELCKATSLPIALEWFVYHPRYMELSLTSAVTALEHLVSVENHDTKDPKLIEKALFKTLRADMEKILTDASLKFDEDKREPFAILKRKLGNLNSSTLRDKIDRYIAHHKVPLTGIDLDAVHAAIGARNDVVHRGQYDFSETEVKLLQHAVLLRELVLRVFFSLLKFEGGYFTYLGGYKMTQFPPKAPEPEKLVTAAPCAVAKGVSQPPSNNS